MPSFYFINVFAYCLRKYTPPIKANITGLPVIPDSRFISTAYDIYILPHGILLSILSTNQHPIKELALEYARYLEGITDEGVIRIARKTGVLENITR